MEIHGTETLRVARCVQPTLAVGVGSGLRGVGQISDHSSETRHPMCPWKDLLLWLYSASMILEPKEPPLVRARTWEGAGGGRPDVLELQLGNVCSPLVSPFAG